MNHVKKDSVQRQFRTTPGLQSLAPGKQIGRTGVLGIASFNHNEWTILPTGKSFELSSDCRGRAMQGAGDVPIKVLLDVHQKDLGSPLRSDLFVVRPMPALYWIGLTFGY
jgi:hypothetical protein